MKINRDQLITLLKEKYDYEIQRKLHYESILNIPVTLLGLLSAGAFYLLNTSNIGCRMWYIDIKIPLISILILSGFVAIYFVFNVLYGYKREYESFPNSDEVKKNFDDAIEYYQKITPRSNSGLLRLLTKSTIEKEIDEKSNELFKDYIVKWYVEINTHNSGINDKRGTNLYWAKMFIGISFLLAFIIFVLSMISKF